MIMITEGITNGLMIERNVTIMEAGDAAPVVAVAGTDSHLSLYPQPGVPLHKDREIERGTAQYSDMHPQGEEGATVPPCPHLLTNDARWLTLLRMRRTGTTTPSLRVRSRQKHLLLLLGPTTRWVVIHRSVQIHHKCFPFLSFIDYA